MRTAAKLRLDFDLDLFTVAILLEKLIQIELLERQVQALQALVPAHPAQI
jgi:chaperone modulatory protein CbpM